MRFPHSVTDDFSKYFYFLCKGMNETLYPKSDIHGVFVNFLLWSAHAFRLSRIEWSLGRKHLTFLEATCLCSFSQCSLLLNKQDKLSEIFVLSMLVKIFAKEIQYQLAHETLKNPLNYLKNCQKPKRENHKTNDFIEGCTCSEKKQ